MEHICVTTKKLIKDWQGEKHIERVGALKEGLRQILTKQEHRHIKYYSIKDSRVTLGVDSCAWLYVLNLKKRQLLWNLNQILKSRGKFIEIILKLDTSQKHTR